MKNILMLVFGIIFFQTVKATEPTPPATNVNCNSALAVCDLTSGHLFNNNFEGADCNVIINQYYYFYTSGGEFSFNVNFVSSNSTSMSGYYLYGPFSNNLPDACEQFNTNNLLLLNSSNTAANSYTPNTSINSLPAGIYLLVIRMGTCTSGTISFNPLKGNYRCEPEIPCENCIPSFELEPEKKYMISVWTKEDNAPVTKTSYDQPSTTLIFKDGTTVIGQFSFSPSGMIIDGWQRIEGEFEVPLNTDNMELRLEVASGDAYFDDIRIFPFDGSMKSYVYDPVTLRLMAELDERNYATIYEYDEEGKLVRLKKETERGIMTIQENKTFIKKTGN